MISDLGTHQFSKYNQDRFLLPYLDRLKQLVKVPVYQKFDKLNIANSLLTINAKKGTSIQGEGLRLYTGKDVKLQHLNLSGPWEISGKNELKIGETVFSLDSKTGILTAKATEDPDYDLYEIQLPKVLN